MTAILEDVVTAKAKADRTRIKIEDARTKLEEIEIELQVKRQKFHKIVGPYPLKWRFKGPYAEAFMFTDWMFYAIFFVASCVVTWLLMQIVGFMAMFLLGITSVYIASQMRFKWARFTNWANTGRG